MVHDICSKLLGLVNLDQVFLRLLGKFENRDDVIPPHRPHVAPRGRVQHLAHMMYKEDDVDLDRAGATGAIVYLHCFQGGNSYQHNDSIVKFERNV